MTATHTPGPWIADGPPSNIHILEADRPHMRVCFMTSDGPTEANARLIAAAPDMLAALKGVLDPGDADDPSLRPEWRAVVDAIAKAEGRPVNAPEPA